MVVSRPGSVASRRVESEVSAGRRVCGIPYAGIDIGDQGPYLPHAVLDGVDRAGEVPENDDLVGDDSACRVPPPQRISNAQSDSPRFTAPGSCSVLERPEGAFVFRQRVAESGIEEEPKTPGTPSGGPDEMWGLNGFAAHFGVRITLSATPCSRSSLNCVSVPRR